MSRSASASQRPRPRMACWRQGPASPAASARIQPVLRRSGPSRPSRNACADAATRSCVNNGRIRLFTSRSDEAHRSNVISSEAVLIQLPSQPHENIDIKQKFATVVLGPVDKLDPDTDATEQDKAEEATVGFVVARGNPPLLLDVSEALDARTQLVQRLVDRILNLAVSLG